MPLSVATASIPLNTGARIPQVGLGVWQTPRGGVTRNAVTAAILAGYRHVDTAKIYGNEAEVGAAILASEVPRDQLFVTTKLWNSEQGYDAALRAFDASLSRLGLAYVDLYLLHWPVAGKRLESWRALEALAEGGRARSIGVSNFLRPHLEELIAHARVVPAVNQIDWGPSLYDRAVLAGHAERGVLVEGYSPLKNTNLRDPGLTAIAAAHGVSAAQVVLRWHLQHDITVIPKSAREERIRENARILHAMRVVYPDPIQKG